MLFAVLGAALVFVILLYFYLTWNYSHWKNLGIPYDKPKLFFGSIKESLTGKKHYGLVYTDIYKKFENAAYVGIFTMRSPALLIRDPEIIKDVLVKEYHSFEENDFHTDLKSDPILAVNPFMHAGDEWKRRRAQWSANLTLSKVKYLFDIMDENQKIMVNYLNKHVEEQPEEPLEARQLVLKYLTDVMVHGTLGLKSNAFEDEKNIFKKIAESLFVSSFWDNLGILAYVIAPWLHSLIDIGFVKKWVRKDLDEISHNIVAVRKEHGFLKNDFFESLLKDPENVEIPEIAGRVFGFLSEGVETSSGLVSFTLYELAANPQVQAKLRKKLDELAAANGGKLSYDDIVNCKYLDMITSETMRQFPAVLVMNRVCTKPITLPPAVPGGEPFAVPVRTRVTICNYATQMDPQYFPDPEKFDPERFAEGNEINKFAYLPFGEGPRICVGMKLGVTNAKTAVCSIIRNFEIRVHSKTIQPVQLDPNVLVSRAVGELWLTFHKIKKD